jgi:hypothetical protein
MTPDPHVALLVVVTLAVGSPMAVAVLQKSGLELRKRQRTCPSCGCRIDARVCSTCR